MIYVMSFKEQFFLHLVFANILINNESLLMQNTLLHSICSGTIAKAYACNPLVCNCDHISRTSMCSVIVEELFRVPHRLPSST